MRKFIALSIALVSVSALADTWTDPDTGITWTYTVSNGKASVGSNTTSAAIPDTTTGSISIPSTLGGCPVTSIGNYAFYRCYWITSVTMPESVVSIGESAFEECYDLKSMPINKGVKVIREYAFYGCSDLISVTIPDSVTSIGSSAFGYCTELSSLNIPDSVTTIGSYAFSCCEGLTSLTIPMSVFEIGDYAFKSCKELTSVTIPSSIKHIGAGVFSGCSKITSVVIEQGNTQLLQIKNGKLQTADGRTVIDHLLRATILSSKIRESDPTIMDLRYKILSTKQTVKVRVLAFEDGTRSFAKVVRPETFIEGTGVNVGDAITPNVEHKISWKVSSDWQTKLAKVKFEVLASEGELLPLETMTIPASDQYGKMKITWNTITASQLFDALLWLYADRDSSLELGNGNLYTREGGDYSPLASGATVKYGDDYYDMKRDRDVHEMGAHEYVFRKMGYSLLTGAPLTYANQETRLGLSPSGARQYGYKIVE